MTTNNNGEEFNDNEGLAIVGKHWSKCVLTLQRLMNQMNMMYYFEKIKLGFKEFKNPENQPTVVSLEKLMTRCLKVYVMIDNFMKIFKLI